MAESAQLSHEDTIDLIVRAQQGDDGATERLLNGNIALVRSIVRRFIGRGAEYDDLFQIGCLGLVKAIRRFDVSFDVRFSTYAVPMIAGEIKRFLRDDGMIKVSRTLKELAARAAAAKEKLSNALGREPAIEEIAREIGAAAEDVLMALESARPHISIYEPVYGEDSDTLVIDTAAAKDDTLDAVDRVMLKELVCALEPRERQLIILRYFMDKTQIEIAGLMGVSQVQVSRMESRILKKLRLLCE